MRNKRNIKLHKDKRGMSLVEVIIAITILALVAVPVLHSLTTSMVYNQKARKRQELTLTAESIMETFKGYDLDSLVARFKPGGIGIEGVSVAVPGDTAYNSDADTGSGYHVSPAIVDDTTIGSAYTFLINDMKADDGQFYDVKITATPNSVEYTMLQDNMEPTHDAVFKGQTDFDTAALQKAKDDFADNTKPYKSDLADYFRDNYPDAVVKMGTSIVAVKDDIDNVFDPSYAAYYVGNSIKLKERELAFEIKEDSGNHLVVPKMIYRYRLEDYTYYLQAVQTPESDEYGGTPGNTGTPQIEEQPDKIAYPKDGDPYLEVEIDLSSVCDGEGTIYKNPTTALDKDGNPKGPVLNRLFIYYYPQYNVDKDTITVKNSANITDFQCYILKQISPALTATQLEVKENGYKANVHIDNSAARFAVFHNFHDNIGDGSSTTEPSITGTYDDEVSYTKAAVKADGSPTTQFAENFSKKKKVLSYKLELEVTQNGRTVTTLESSMNEKLK